MEEEVLKDPLLDLDNLDDLETATPNPEEDKDNSDKSDDKDQEEGKEETPKKEPTAKEIRHQQQEEGRLAEVKRLKEMVIEAEVAKASNDASSLLELAKKDPKLADEVAKKFWYSDFKDAKKQITAWEEVESKKSTIQTEDDLEDWYQKRKAKDEHEQSLVEAKTLIDELPEEDQEEAIELFNDLVDGKTLTREKALKYAKMVTLSLKKEVVSTKKIDKADWLKKLSSTGMSQSKKVSNNEPQMVIFGGEEILLDSKQIN